MTALIKRRGFVIDSTVNHRFIRPAIYRQIDSILDAGADFVAVVFLEQESWPSQANSQRRELRVVYRAHVRHSLFQLV